MTRCFPIVVALSFLLAMTLASRGNDDSPTKPEPSQSVKEARTHMAEIAIRSLSNGRDIEIERLPNPLMTYGDAARNNEAGTLWVWGKSGRPVAFLELYRNVGKNEPWVHALTLTSPELTQLTGPNGNRWTPKKSHFALSDIPNAPEVGAQPAVRLRQMKEISRRLEAHEFWDPNNSRFELRLLVQPVHRYHDESSKVLDGAVFVLAHGTNPEVLVQIEADDTEQPPRWRFSFARLGSAELHVLLDGQEVWTQSRTPNIVGQPIDPYWLFWTK